ncbi:MAG TPA: flagellar hook-length control protein FliK [Treponemataceae bacterium]|nr:flagellar hook-length control protein FliK [Treponemataceae bacterium]
MQALNLHLEQTAAIQSPSTHNLQGSKNVSHDESAFQKELQKVRNASQEVKDAHKAQEMPGTTDGNQKLETTKAKEAHSVDEPAFLDFSNETVPEVNDGFGDLYLNESRLDQSGNTDSSLLNTPVDLNEADEYFSVSSEDSFIELLPEQESYLLQDRSLVPPDNSLPAEEKTRSVNALLLNEKSDNELKISGGDTNNEDAVLQSLLTGQVSLAQYALKEDSPATESGSSKITTDQRDLIGTSNEALISVIDERSITKEAAAGGKFVSEVKYDGNGNAEMSLNLPQNSMYQEPQSGNSAAVMTSNARFTEMLSSELQSNAKEFVKTGSVILKDNNNGTIKLILHPEELGNVKIRLEVTDKVIAGKIIVSSEEAFNAFKVNLDSLRQAFTDSGFEAGGFDLSWNSGGQGSGQDKDHNPRGYVYNDALPEIFDDDYALQLARDAVIYGTSVINMIA